MNIFSNVEDEEYDWKLYEFIQSNVTASTKDYTVSLPIHLTMVEDVGWIVDNLMNDEAFLDAISGNLVSSMGKMASFS